MKAFITLSVCTTIIIVTSAFEFTPNNILPLNAQFSSSRRLCLIVGVGPLVLAPNDPVSAFVTDPPRASVGTGYDLLQPSSAVQIPVFPASMTGEWIATRDVRR